MLTKLLVARTPRAVVEEIVLPEGLKFPLENWDEFEEREHHLSSEQLQVQSNVVSYILNWCQGRPRSGYIDEHDVYGFSHRLFSAPKDNPGSNHAVKLTESVLKQQ